MIFKCEPRRVVRSWAGQGTGETIRQDDHGTIYREVTEAEARLIEQGTAGRVYRIDRNGFIR